MLQQTFIRQDKKMSETMGECAKCKERVNKEHCVECALCKLVFDADCAGLSEVEFRVLGEARSRDGEILGTGGTNGGSTEIFEKLSRPIEEVFGGHIGGIKEERIEGVKEERIGEIKEERIGGLKDQQIGGVKDHIGGVFWCCESCRVLMKKMKPVDNDNKVDNKMEVKELKNKKREDEDSKELRMESENPLLTLIKELKESKRATY